MDGAETPPSFKMLANVTHHCLLFHIAVIAKLELGSGRANRFDLAPLATQPIAPPQKKLLLLLAHPVGQAEVLHVLLGKLPALLAARPLFSLWFVGQLRGCLCAAPLQGSSRETQTPHERAISGLQKEETGEGSSPPARWGSVGLAPPPGWRVVGCLAPHPPYHQARKIPSAPKVMSPKIGVPGNMGEPSGDQISPLHPP